MAPAAALLERDDALRVLREAIADAQHGAGRLVLLEGEAGIGKSALVRQLPSLLRSRRVIVGACDPLSTPRPLGPFADMAAAWGGSLRAALASGGDAGGVY